MSDLSWLTKVKLPVNIHRQNPVKGTFRFYPTKKVDVIGSFGFKTFVHRHENVDVGIEIPKVIGNETVFTTHPVFNFRMFIYTMFRKW